MITEELLPKNTVFTIDDYYNIEQYNEAIQALENNNIQYTEWISTISPYKFYIYAEDKLPVLMNYDIVKPTEWKALVSKVKPLKSNDEYLLYRRYDKISKFKHLINNDAFERAFKSDHTLVIHYKNTEMLQKISRSYGRVYPIGWYLNGKYKLALCFDPNVKNILEPGMLLKEIGKHKVGQLEAEINYDILRNMDKIEKWIETPYFEDGKLYQPSPRSPMKFMG